MAARAPRDLAVPLLAGAVTASGALLLVLGAKLTFLLDDWTFLVYRQGFDEDSILAPHGEHIVVGPILVYKALLATAGMGSALPFRVASTAMFLLSAVLLFAWLRRRVDEWLALLGTVLVLFAGAAWEDLLWSFQIGFFTAVAGGLGMLLGLERRDRRGDVVACASLTLAMVFSSTGIPFAIGGAVEILRRPDHWRRIYVVLVPLAIYGAWWIGWGHTAESAVSAENVLSAPLFLLNGIAAALASIFNLFGAFDLALGPLTWGRILTVPALLLAAWRVRRLGHVPEWLWVVGAIALSFWLLAAFNEKPGRTPDSSRYQYLGIVFVLMIAAELLRGVRPGPRALAAAAVVVAACVACNVKVLVDAYDGYRFIGELERADLAAVEIARDTVEPGFVLSEDIADTSFVHVEAGPYLAAVDDFGSPAYTPEELAAAPWRARFAADKVLYSALRVAPGPLPAAAIPPGPHPPGERRGDGSVAIPAGACVTVPPGDSRGPLLALPPDGASFRAGRAPIENVRMTRFSGDRAFPVDLESGLRPGRAAIVRIAPDRSTVPWKLKLETGGRAIACGLKPERPSD